MTYVYIMLYIYTRYMVFKKFIIKTVKVSSKLIINMLIMFVLLEQYK